VQIQLFKMASFFLKRIDDTFSLSYGEIPNTLMGFLVLKPGVTISISFALGLFFRSSKDNYRIKIDIFFHASTLFGSQSPQNTQQLRQDWRMI